MLQEIFHFQASLASIHDATDNLFLQNLSGGQWAWVGGYRSSGNRAFAWTDSSAWNYSNWARNQPDDDDPENCVHINFDHSQLLQGHKTGQGQWNNIACVTEDNHKMGYICQKPIQKTNMKFATFVRNTYDSMICKLLLNKHHISMSKYWNIFPLHERLNGH